MPIRNDACNGPCNRAARDAWDGYDQAVDAYPAQIVAFKQVYQRYQDEVAAWHAPLLDYPTEPQQPHRPEPPTIPVAIADPTWCGRCPRTIERALRDIDDTAALLSASVDGHRGGNATGPNGTAAPDHKAIIDTLDELYRRLARVEDQWREFRGYTSRPRRAAGNHARTLTITWLLGELDDILLHEGSVDFGLGVLGWQRRLLKMTKSDPVTRRSPIDCPRCGEQQVRRRDDYYECETCGRLLNQEEHDREFSKQADQADHERQEVHAS